MSCAPKFCATYLPALPLVHEPWSVEEISLIMLHIQIAQEFGSHGYRGMFYIIFDIQIEHTYVWTLPRKHMQVAHFLRHGHYSGIFSIDCGSTSHIVKRSQPSFYHHYRHETHRVILRICRYIEKHASKISDCSTSIKHPTSHTK